MAIALGAAHAVAVTEDGGVFVYGAGAHGQLGTGALVPRELRPTLLCERLGGTRVANVAAGFRHSVAITEDGGCWTWGFGANGRLGHGNEERGLVPKKIPPKQLQGAKAVMAACSSLLAGHTALVTDDGNLWTWGRGSEGQLGHHDLQTKLVPTLIARDLFAGAAISMVACGGSHTTCVTNFGALWSWGANDWGQLGHGDVERRELPALVRGTGEGGIRILVVSCGDRNTAAVTSSGSLWVWGAGDAGRLGLGDELYRLVPTEIGSDRFSGKKVVLVDCGFSHTGAITVDGELWMWGSDVNGQLGIGRIEGCPDRLVPTRVCVDGMENDRFATVSCGVQSTTAVTENGLVWAWGSADQGVLGLGCERVTMQPTHVGGFGARIGRCRQLPTCCATAFAMSQHHRLGQNSKASVLVGDLVQRILEAAHSWPQGPADQASGVLRLMGGGLTVPPRTLESVCHGTNPTADISMEGSRSMQQESETLAAAGEEGIADAGGEEQMISREAVADVSVEQPSMELEAHDDHFVLPGHELQSQPPVSPNTTQLHPTQIPASGLNSQAPATSEGSAEPSAVPEHTSSAPTSSATPSRKEHHLILPARVRLAGGTRPRPVFSGTTLLLAESSDGSSLVTSDAPTESSVTSAVTSAPVGDREASVGMNAASSSLPPAAGGPAITPSFRGPKQTPSHPPPRQLESAGPEIELCGDEYLYACAQEHGNTGQATTNTSLKLPSPHAHRQLQEAPGPGEKAAVQLLPAEKNFSGSGGDVGAKRDENSVANRMPGEAIGSDVGAEGEIVTSEMIARLESFYLRHDPSLISDARRILVLFLWCFRADCIDVSKNACVSEQVLM